MYNKVLTMYASAMSETLPLGKSILHSAHKSPANLDLPLVHTSQVLPVSIIAAMSVMRSFELTLRSLTTVLYAYLTKLSYS